MRIARLTPPGPGGVALLRCEGPGARAHLDAAFRPAHGRGLPAAGRVALGVLHDPAGEPLDEILPRARAPQREAPPHRRLQRALDRAQPRIAADAGLEVSFGCGVGRAVGQGRIRSMGWAGERPIQTDRRTADWA